jgi:VWFA-related protein
MRATVAVSVALTASLLGGLAGRLAAQTAQTPIFRSGVELLEVDVSVVDGQGRPVSDLRGPEFVVTVDGQPRRVVTSDFISDTSAEVQSTSASVDPYISNNTDRRPGRLIMLVVDQNNMTMERVRGTVAAIGKFITGLGPNDRLALASIPSPGPRVDFTTNHAQVLAALNGVAGNGDAERGRFNISNYEALAFDQKSDTFAIQRMLVRLCGDSTPAMVAVCGADVEQEAMELAQRIRLQTTESVSAMGALLKGLKDVEGSKSLILLSQGLMLEGTHSEATALAQLAAEARVNINVMMFDWLATSASERMVSATQPADRDLREAGLETLASRSRGSMFRVASNPQYIFERITTELSGHYMLGVEPSGKDRDGKSHDIQVHVGRKGTQVRARREFQYATRAPNTWSRDDLMGHVLGSPSSTTQIPMRVSTYTYQDASDSKVKLIVAAEIDPTTDGVVDVAIGHALYDKEGRAVDAGQERKIYSPNSDRPLKYELVLSVNPGTYRFRLAAIDLAGNSGSVEREVQAWQTAGQELAVGDLMLSGVREAQSGNLRPPVTLRIDDGQVASFTELYTNRPGALEEAKVVFEIAEDAEAPTLRSGVADIRARAGGTAAQASAIVPLGALPPGRYVVRAMISAAGRTVGKMVRPFLLVAGSRPAAPEPSAVAAATPANAAVAAPAAPVDSGLVGGRPSGFKRDDVLKPDVLRAVYEVMDKNHPSAKGAIARARGGKLAGTALMALDAGDQAAGAILRGLEFLSNGQLDPAATQFGVALRSAPDSALASFYLGACYAAVGKDKEAVTNWERARAAQLPLPGVQVVLAEAWLRLGQPAQAVEPLRDALARQPQNDPVRKDLAIVQSMIGQHEQAYATVTPYLASHGSDADALMVALQAIYQVHAEGKSLDTPEQDKAKATEYARAYAAAKGPNQALVDKWLEFLAK